MILNHKTMLNPLNAQLNPIFHLLALLGAHHILHVSRIRVKEQLPTGITVRCQPKGWMANEFKKDI
jgi:hypothetical protein